MMPLSVSTSPFEVALKTFSKMFSNAFLPLFSTREAPEIFERFTDVCGLHRQHERKLILSLGLFPFDSGDKRHRLSRCG